MAATRSGTFLCNALAMQGHLDNLCGSVFGCIDKEPQKRASEHLKYIYRMFDNMCYLFGLS